MMKNVQNEQVFKDRTKTIINRVTSMIARNSRSKISKILSLPPWTPVHNHFFHPQFDFWWNFPIFLPPEKFLQENFQKHV